MNKFHGVRSYRAIYSIRIPFLKKRIICFEVRNKNQLKPLTTTGLSEIKNFRKEIENKENGMPGPHFPSRGRKSYSEIGIFYQLYANVTGLRLLLCVLIFL